MKRLIALPFRKSLEIAFQSIRVRFFRSLVTTTSLVLAVAFLCYMRSCNDFAQGLLNSGDISDYQALVKAGYDVSFGSDVIAASAKQRWIVTLSLLVCIVGIINAQLMSVTERFREIGTMKCLGALDRFIVRLFVLEALMQGLIMLQDAIEQERRPLSWVVGDQQVIKPQMPSRRDLLQKERNQAKELRGPTKV